MSDLSVLYKSCVAHLAKWTTLFAKFKCFDLDFFVCKKTECENVEPCE